MGLLLAPGAARGDTPSSPSPPAALTRLKPHERSVLQRYPALAAEIRPEGLAVHVRALTAHGSRVVGYPGERAAAEYVRGQFQSLFGRDEEHYREETFPVTTPVDRGGELRLPSGERFALHALWPNGVRTSQLPRAGLEAPVLWGERGQLEELNGRDVEGAVVVIEFNTASAWLNAARLGAAAVVFVEPEETMRGEAENKLLSVPVALPRFWISRAEAACLIPRLQVAEPPRALLRSECRWETVSATSFWGKIDGSDSEAREQVVVVHAYYDAMSVVPALAPGAENAVSMAGLLELAKVYRKFPPRRTVWFLATSAHFLGLQGVRAYLQRHLDEFAAPSASERAAATLSDRAPWLTRLPGPLRWSLFAVFVLLVLGLGLQAGRRRSLGLAVVALAALAPAAGLLLTQRFTPARSPPQLLLFAGLDLSSQSKGVGAFYKGYYYDYREDLQNRFAELGRTLKEHGERVALVTGQDPKTLYADGINPTEGKNWRSFIPGKIALDAEVWSLAGARGIAFATFDDARPYVDTPFDTPDRLNLDNVAVQTRTLACLFDHLLNDSGLQEPNAFRMPVQEPSRFARLGLQGGFASVVGRVVRFDLKESFIPSTPVPGALAVLSGNDKTLMGVRGGLVQEVAPDGSFRFDGVPPTTAYQTPTVTHVRAYHLDPDTGDLDYAPDLGHTGARAYPIDLELNLPQKTAQVIVFQCASTSLYDFVDPQTLKTLTDVHVYDGATNAEPRMYGMAVPHAEKLQAAGEDAAVFFAQPGFALKVVMGPAPGAPRLVLIHSTYDRERRYDEEGQNQGRILNPGVAEGTGYRLGEDRGPPTDDRRGTTGDGRRTSGDHGPRSAVVGRPEASFVRTIPYVPYRAALDMWRWDDWNAEKLRKYRIINQQLDDLHNRAGQYLLKAEAAMRERDHAAAYTYARIAHAYEARAYPEVQRTARDVVKGVMFYLALLLPFAFFVERLVVGSTTLRSQLAWFFGIFIAVFAILTQIHPAFDITMSPMIVLLAFIMLALSGLVIALIVGKFEQQLKQLHRQVSGAHAEDIGRASIAAAAFSLGISNMRRRKVRTVLTCVTLVLLTFIVLSFTSIVSSLHYNVVPAPGRPAYDGLLLRTATWEPLEETSYRLLSDEFGRRHPVAARAWYFGTQTGDQASLSLQRGDRRLDVRAVVGLDPQEPRLTGADRALAAGRWFVPADGYAAILPREAAETLGIAPEAVVDGSARVRYAGVDYAVVGLLDSDRFKEVRDLDQEPLTPVEYRLSQAQSTAGATAVPVTDDYTHLEPGQVFLMPYRTLMSQGGQVRSVAVGLESPEAVTRTRLDLMPRLGLNLYAGEGGQTFRYSSIGGTSIAGAGTLFVPVLIAALIVLNTMLGAVFERQKEIHIFSSIGLAPAHVATLFMAESLVYAVLGAMSGYVLGQGAAKAIVAFHLLPGLNLNFSSLAAVFSTLLVMGVVLLSTVYPARKAGEVATPALDRTWKTPEPEGDRWEIPLPFMVTGNQAAGLNAFLQEWLQSYEEYSVGDMVTQGIRAEEQVTPQGPAYHLGLTAWLAPFDLGVSQRVEVHTTPTDMGDVFALRLVLHRQSGDVRSWRRVNRRFLNLLRKQFLIWRTLGAEERGRYGESPAGETGHG